jgi:hypothetical protein
VPVKGNVLAACVALGVFAAAAPARGDSASDKQQCASAYESGQRLRHQRNLVEAREQLLVCSRLCSPALQGECLDWIHEVELATPSVVVSARSAAGGDVVDVSVFVDGRPFASRLDGKALDLDPGQHTFRFIPASGKAIEQHYVIREGDKARELPVFLDDGRPSALPSFPPDPQASHRPIPILGWAFAGVAVVGLGSFATFGLTGRSEQDSTLGTCNPHCSPSQTDDVLHKYIAADVSLGISVAALAVAAVLVLTRPTRPIRTTLRDPGRVGFAF